MVRNSIVLDGRRKRPLDITPAVFIFDQVLLSLSLRNPVRIRDLLKGFADNTYVIITKVMMHR